MDQLAKYQFPYFIVADLDDGDFDDLPAKELVFTVSIEKPSFVFQLLKELVEIRPYSIELEEIRDNKLSVRAWYFTAVELDSIMSLLKKYQNILQHKIIRR